MASRPRQHTGWPRCHQGDLAAIVLARQTSTDCQVHRPEFRRRRSDHPRPASHLGHDGGAGRDRRRETTKSMLRHDVLRRDRAPGPHSRRGSAAPNTRCRRRRCPPGAPGVGEVVVAGALRPLPAWRGTVGRSSSARRRILSVEPGRYDWPPTRVSPTSRARGQVRTSSRSRAASGVEREARPHAASRMAANCRWTCTSPRMEREHVGARVRDSAM
jgi:hypothetical protein